MISLKQGLFSLLLALTASVIVGCGGGGGGGVVDDGGSGGTGTEISGVVEAPSGVIAMFEEKPLGIQMFEMVMPSAYAAITGLQPVGGATVELIEIDNNGDQVGAVLATTVTSITGDYTLTLPAGTDFAANLIVRITGTGGSSLTAQVVEAEVGSSRQLVQAPVLDARVVGVVEIVHALHRLPLLQQHSAHVGADESGASGNQDAH